MSWFKSIMPPKNDESPLPEGLSAEQEKQWRISQLTNDECKVFEWFRLGYTARWTAETMLLDRKTARKLFSSLCRKLLVSDEVELSRVYRTISLKPEDLPPEEDP